MAAAPICAESAPCKICQSAAPLFGVLDFNKHGSEERVGRFSLSGVPIYYRRCRSCGFIFSEMLDDWSPRQFAERIYNADYVKVDPDYLDARPRGNAKRINQLFGAHRAELSCLDYGGGTGQLAELLREAGFKRAETYDKHVAAFDRPPTGPFNLITCFEVFEHEPRPGDLAASLSSLLADEGLILFSTLLQPDDIEQLGVSWWYIAPRNGHISIFSRRSLSLVLQRHGLGLVSFDANLHIALKRVPAFATGFLTAKN